MSDDNGNTVGAVYSVQDVIGGGHVTGTPPCAPHPNFDISCPFGSSVIQVTLGGGADSFRTQDQTLGKPFSCLTPQAAAALQLDSGSGSDLIDGSRLADTIAGGSGSDAIASWDGNDRVSGGPGVDLIETHDGNDVADGGSGNDVIHLDSNPLDRESCFRPSKKPGNDIGRGGPGNDAITGDGGNDRIEGGAGNDELGAGKGHDKLLGGPGRDTIYSRDGQRDYVNCGSGKDVLLASDRKDRVVGCEKRSLRPR